MKKNGAEEHISLLKKYYEYDEEKRIFTIPFKYEKASDLLDTEVKDPTKHPRFKKEVLEDVKDSLAGLPSGVKADIHLVIADYEGYDPEVLMDAFNDAITLNSYRSRLDQRRSGLTAAILALVGAAVLLLYIFGENNGWFGDDKEATGYLFITEMIDIVAWVFVWEAVTIIFLYNDDYRSLNAGLFLKANDIGFYDVNGKQMLSQEYLANRTTMSSLLKRWENIGRDVLLVASTAIIMYGAYSLVKFIGELIAFAATPAEYQAVYVAACIIGILIGLLYLFIGIGGIFIFMDKPYLRTFTGVATISMSVILLIYLVNALLTNDFSTITSMAFTILIYCLFLVGYLVCYFAERQRNGKGKKKK